jgi:hypothetical protein
MLWKSKRHPHDKSLDRVAESVIGAAGLDEAESDGIASSPLLYSRLRARIEAERARRQEPVVGWFATFKAARLAIPALALVAVIAVASFWFSVTKNTVGAPPGVAREEDGYQLAPVSACSLSATDECAISNEEVLATMFARQEGEEQR